MTMLMNGYRPFSSMGILGSIHAFSFLRTIAYALLGCTARRRMVGFSPVARPRAPVWGVQYTNGVWLYHGFRVLGIIGLLSL